MAVILLGIMAFLRKNNLQGTEDTLKKELQKFEKLPTSGGVAGGQSDDVSNVLQSYKNDGDPSSYEAAYSDLESFVESSLDMYRHELALILYPVFVHMYLELVYNEVRIIGRRCCLSLLFLLLLFLHISTRTMQGTSSRLTARDRNLTTRRTSRSCRL